MQITRNWKTIATVGFSGSVSLDNENPAAHGGVCLLQVRQGSKGLLGRKINVNQRHQEKGNSFELEERQLEIWRSIR